MSELTHATAQAMMGRTFRVGGKDGADALVIGVTYHLSGDTQFQVSFWQDGKRSTEWIGPAELGDEVVAQHPFGFRVARSSDGGAM